MAILRVLMAILRVLTTAEHKFKQNGWLPKPYAAPRGVANGHAMLARLRSDACASISLNSCGAGPGTLQLSAADAAS